MPSFETKHIEFSISLWMPRFEAKPMEFSWVLLMQSSGAKIEPIEFSLLFECQSSETKPIQLWWGFLMLSSSCSKSHWILQKKINSTIWSKTNYIFFTSPLDLTGCICEAKPIDFSKVFECHNPKQNPLDFQQVKVTSSDGLLPNALMAVDLRYHIVFIEESLLSKLPSWKQLGE